MHFARILVLNYTTWMFDMLFAGSTLTWNRALFLTCDNNVRGECSRRWVQHAHVNLACTLSTSSSFCAWCNFCRFMTLVMTVSCNGLEGHDSSHDFTLCNRKCYTWNITRLKNTIFQNLFKIEFELISRELGGQIEKIKKKRTCSSVKNNSL